MVKDPTLPAAREATTMEPVGAPFHSGLLRHTPKRRNVPGCRAHLFRRLQGQAAASMESPAAFRVSYPGWPHTHPWVAVAALCLAAVAWKLAALLAQRRRALRSVESFPGPRAHWLFGNVREVNHVAWLRGTFKVRPLWPSRRGLLFFLQDNTKKPG